MARSVYPNGHETLCGLSWIHPEWVLTSVGCANRPESITLGTGSNSLNNRTITLPSAQLIFHKQFQDFLKQYSTNKNIQIISLPTRAQSNNLFKRQSVWIARFSSVENEDDITSDTEPS